MFVNNPIINNRIVNDITFAVRLLGFVKDVIVNDPVSDEEKVYILNIAQNLLDYQIETVTDETEIKYLQNLKLL